MGLRLDDQAATGANQLGGRNGELRVRRKRAAVQKESTSQGVTTYTLAGVYEAGGERDIAAETHFFYDAAGKPAAVRYGTKYYYYVYNLQGNVVALLNSSTLTPVVEYFYDAWGKPTGCTGPLANTLGKDNPFRYRGYVYDEETGLYYLRSRYYNPEWGRFINADALITRNLFAYCGNNPVCKSDSGGHSATSAINSIPKTGIPGLDLLMGLLKVALVLATFITTGVGGYPGDKISGSAKANNPPGGVAQNQGYTTATTEDDVKDTLRNNDDGDSYWFASVSPEKGAILIGPPVSAKIAQSVVLSGLTGADIFAVNSAAAYDLAYDAAKEIGGKSDFDSPHVNRPGLQLPHYHVWDALEHKLPGHVLFIQ